MQVEYDKIVDEVSEQYGYSEELNAVLKRILPAMLAEATEESKQAFYRMLRKTPIAVLPAGAVPKKRELDRKYLGLINTHIIDLDSDALGEYGEAEASAAYCSDAVLDGDLNIVDVKQYIYVKESFSGESANRQEARALLGTSINVPHLIHELGHAWNGEFEQYTKRDGKLIQRVGVGELVFELKPIGNGRYTRQIIESRNIECEEAFNTIAEEEAMIRYLGVSQDQIQELYKNLFIPSGYQGILSDMGRRFLSLGEKANFDKWRLTGDISAIGDIVYLMSQTDAYKNRNKETEHTAKKRQLFEKPISKIIGEFFKKRESDFFYDKMELSPVEILGKSMREVYTLQQKKYWFDITTAEGLQFYKDFSLETMRGGYLIINQTRELIKDTDRTRKLLADREARPTNIQGIAQLVGGKMKKLPTEYIIHAARTIGKLGKLEKENENENSASKIRRYRDKKPVETDI